jgi:hypothetical protein
VALVASYLLILPIIFYVIIQRLGESGPFRLSRRLGAGLSTCSMHFTSVDKLFSHLPSLDRDLLDHFGFLGIRQLCHKFCRHHVTS